MNRASGDQHTQQDPQHQGQKPSSTKRPWAKPQIMEENFRNTEQVPELPFSPQQVS